MLDQELTLFGGLAKAQTPKQIEIGALRISESPTALTWIRLEIPPEVRIEKIKIEPSYNDMYGLVKRTIYLGMDRFFEIWGKGDAKTILRGLGGTNNIKGTIGGKIGLVNNKCNELYKTNGNWAVKKTGLFYGDWKVYANKDDYRNYTTCSIKPLPQDAVKKAKQVAWEINSIANRKNG